MLPPFSSPYLSVFLYQFWPFALCRVYINICVYHLEERILSSHTTNEWVRASVTSGSVKYELGSGTSPEVRLYSCDTRLWDTRLDARSCAQVVRKIPYSFVGSTKLGFPGGQESSGCHLGEPLALRRH